MILFQINTYNDHLPIKFSFHGNKFHIWIFFTSILEHFIPKHKRTPLGPTDLYS